MAKRKETEDPQQAAPLRLDAENEEFLKGEERLHLGQIPFEVLRFLVERRPHVVTKDEFYEAVWKPKDKEMTDWTLTSCMSEVRGALGSKSK